VYADLPLLFCGSGGAAIRLARDGGLPADQSFKGVHNSNCGSGLAREDGLTANQSVADVLNPIVGASLLAMAALQPTIILWLTPAMWRGSLLPLGREAAPKSGDAVCQADRIERICDCCAAERDGAAFRQAPSPQGFVFVRVR
jgi:hypothetical protein